MKPRTGKTWTYREDNQLKKLFFQGRSIVEIADIMRRRKDAIVHRLIHLELIGYSYDGTPENHGTPWHDKEEKNLKREFNEGFSIEEIAKKHKRQRNAILHQLIHLRLFDFTSREMLQRFSDRALFSEQTTIKNGTDDTTFHDDAEEKEQDRIGYAQLKKKILDWIEQGYLVNDLLERLEETQTQTKEDHEVQEPRYKEKREEPVQSHIMSKKKKLIIVFQKLIIVFLILFILIGVVLGAYNSFFLSMDKIQNTPNIACTTDSTTNRIQIATADANIKWSDIAITTDVGATWQVFSSNGNALAQTGNTVAITTDIMAGDYIVISGTTGNVRVTLKYTPTNSLLGMWTVNV